MPRLTPQLRLERRADLDLSHVRLTPAEAADRAALLTVMDPARLSLRRVDGLRRHRRAPRGRRPLGRPHRRQPLHRLAGGAATVRRDADPARSVDPELRRLAAAPQVRGRRPGRHGAVRLARHGRGRHADHAPQPRAGLDGGHSALVLFLGAAPRSAAVVSDRRLERDAGLCAGRHRPRARRHAVPVAQVRGRPAAGRRRRAHPLHRLDAVALFDRRRLRCGHADLGVQRAAVDGAVRLDQRPRAGAAARHVHGRAARPGAVPGARRRGLGAADRGPRRPRGGAASHSGRSELPRAAGAGAGRRRQRPAGAPAPAVLPSRAVRSATGCWSRPARWRSGSAPSAWSRCWRG